MIAVVAGLLLGTASFLLGRRSGRLVNAGINIAVAFPGILLALFFAVIFGVGATGAVLAIGFAGAPAFGRLVQTLVASVAARDYVAAARVAGVGRVRILTRHVLPNISEPLVVNATIGAGGALLSFAGLSFLGLGVQQPAYDWGRLLFDGIGSIYVNPAAALAPGAAVLLAGLAFNLFGESVAKGLGVGVVGGIPAAARRPGAARGREVAADGVRTTCRRPTWCSTCATSRSPFPGPRGPIRPVRGISLRRAPGRGASASWGSRAPASR